MFNLYVLNDAYTNGYQTYLLNVISVLSVLCGISVIIAKNPIVSVLYLIGLFFSIASYLMSLGLNFIGLSYLLVYVGAVSILFLFILMLINVRISELVTDNNNSLILAILIGLFIITPIYAKGSYYNVINKAYYNSGSGTNIQEVSSSFNNADYTINQSIINESWSLSEDLTQSLSNVFQNFAPFPSWAREGYDTENTNIYFVTSKLWDGVLGEMSHITSIGNIIYTSYPLWLILTSIILLLAMVGAIVITIKQ